MLSHYVQLSSSMHARLLVAYSSMHAYLVGLEALDLISVWASRLSSLCAHGHNNGSEVCLSSDVLVRLPRLVWVVDVRITDSFVLSVHAFQIFFCDFMPEEDADFSSISKYILH